MCELSVIIPAHNRAESISLCLEHLAHQQGVDGGVEVIVVDDHSTDGTEGLARSGQHGLVCKVVKNEGPVRSAAQARNIGAENARGTHFLFLDADILCDPLVIRRHLELHQAFENAVVLGYVNAQESQPADFILRTPEYRRYATLGWAARSTMFQAHSDLPDVRRHFHRGGVHPIQGCAAPWFYCWTQLVSVPRSVFSDFDPSFSYKGNEDLEWGYRLHQRGCQFILADESSTFHYPHERDRIRDIRVDRENMYRFLGKHPHMSVEALAAFDCMNANDVLAMIHNLLPNCIDTPEVGEDWETLLAQLSMDCRVNMMLGVMNEPFADDEVFTFVAGPHDSFSDFCGQPNTSMLNLMGYGLPFQDGAFTLTVLGSLYAALPEELLCRILQETLRVSQRVMLYVPTDSCAVSRPASRYSLPIPYWAKVFYVSTEFEDFVFSRGMSMKWGELVEVTEKDGTSELRNHWSTTRSYLRRHASK